MCEVINLSALSPFGKGGNRQCYVDPREEKRCIKVALPDKTARQKRARVRGWKKFRPLYYYDDNLRELKSYRQIEKHLPAEVWTHLPPCYGMVESDLSPGIVTGLVRNDDGAISPDLRGKMRREGNTPEIRAAAAELCAYLRKTLLPTRDLLLHNIVARDCGGGRCELHIIDGFGSADIVPYAYWLKGLARKKTERKIVKFERKIATLCEKESLPFHP